MLLSSWGRVQEGKCKLPSNWKVDLNVESKLSRGSSLLFVSTTNPPPFIGIVKCAIDIAGVRQKEFDVEARDNVRDTVP